MIQSQLVFLKANWILVLDSLKYIHILQPVFTVTSIIKWPHSYHPTRIKNQQQAEVRVLINVKVFKRFDVKDDQKILIFTTQHAPLTLAFP